MKYFASHSFYITRVVRPLTYEGMYSIVMLPPFLLIPVPATPLPEKEETVENPSTAEVARAKKQRVVPKDFMLMVF